MNTIGLIVLVGAVALACGEDDGYSYPLPGNIIRQEPIIQKHIYVHVPPPDPEFHAPPHRVISPPPPKKHYKIVFIKAPTYSPPTVPPLPEIQQNEEKTLIYVLHKNPQEAPPIVLPSVKPTQPSKPEVYFIRYKTQKEVNFAPSPSSSLRDDGPSGFHLVGSTAAPRFVSSTPIYHTSIGKRKVH